VCTYEFIIVVIYDFEILDLDNILTESKLGKLVLFSYDVICCIHVLLLIIDHKKPDEFPREKMDKAAFYLVSSESSSFLVTDNKS
jgi:hypothetical protein